MKTKLLSDDLNFLEIAPICIERTRFGVLLKLFLTNLPSPGRGQLGIGLLPGTTDDHSACRPPPATPGVKNTSTGGMARNVTVSLLKAPPAPQRLPGRPEVCTAQDSGTVFGVRETPAPDTTGAVRTLSSPQLPGWRGSSPSGEGGERAARERDAGRRGRQRQPVTRWRGLAGREAPNPAPGVAGQRPSARPPSAALDVAGTKPFLQRSDETGVWERCHRPPHYGRAGSHTPGPAGFAEVEAGADPAGCPVGPALRDPRGYGTHFWENLGRFWR